MGILRDGFPKREGPSNGGREEAMRVLLAVLAGMIVFSATASAKPPRVVRPPKRVVDRNKDGVVGPRERAIARHKTKRYLDKNRDGVVGPKEKAIAAHKAKRYLDRNKDGKIDRHERRLAWRKHRRKVNTPLEKRFDADGNGWIGPAEARKMLHAKWGIVKRNGRAKVDTEIEKEYDANGDGWIDRKEAVQLKADLDEKEEEQQTE